MLPHFIAGGNRLSYRLFYRTPYGVYIKVFLLAHNYIREGGIESLMQTVQSYGWFQTFQEKVLSSELLKENLSNLLLKTTQMLANLATGQLAKITKNVFFLLVLKENIFGGYL